MVSYSTSIQQRLDLVSVYHIAIFVMGAKNTKLVKVKTWSWETYLEGQIKGWASNIK